MEIEPILELKLT